MKVEAQKERIEFSPNFNKKLTLAPLEIKHAFRDALELFRESPHNVSLRNHSLKEKYAGIQSINVTGDWRALYRIKQNRIIFVELGTHDMLYG
ncbi:MAG TPA: type II toxin-antitoxin system mRNA interferase toxin, RelE/StbE family [Candidatus Acidoferrales bacterium]|nr:type II toxin-antitoxin system mRNA interferase toxin, RelE/StbE family [Candidatus Acidoferrales bacterium]